MRYSSQNNLGEISDSYFYPFSNVLFYISQTLSLGPDTQVSWDVKDEKKVFQIKVFKMICLKVVMTLGIP